MRTGAGAGTQGFGYDPLGRRIRKVAGGVTYKYAYDGQDIIKETRSVEGQADQVYTYVHGPGIDEPLARIQRVGESEVANYYHTDALGSIVAMTDDTGAVVSTRRYDAWGNLELGADEPGYAFTGREWDPETGLYYYRARYYDPKVGRFISEDPIGFAGGVDFYAYVGNDPTALVDPYGWAQHGKKNLRVEDYGKHSDEDAIRRSIEEARLDRNFRRANELGRLLKTIKNKSMRSCFVPNGPMIEMLALALEEALEQATDLLNRGWDAPDIEADAPPHVHDLMHLDKRPLPSLIDLPNLRHQK